MLQLHLCDQQLYCLPTYPLYQMFKGIESTTSMAASFTFVNGYVITPTIYTGYNYLSILGFKLIPLKWSLGWGGKSRQLRPWSGSVWIYSLQKINCVSRGLLSEWCIHISVGNDWCSCFCNATESLWAWTRKSIILQRYGQRLTLRCIAFSHIKWYFHLPDYWQTKCFVSKIAIGHFRIGTWMSCMKGYFFTN